MSHYSIPEEPKTKRAWIQWFLDLPPDVQSCVTGIIIGRAMELGLDFSALEEAKDDKDAVGKAWQLSRKVDRDSRRMVPAREATCTICMLIVRLGGRVEFSREDSEEARTMIPVGSFDEGSGKLILRVEQTN